MPPRRAWSEPDEQVYFVSGVPKGIRTPVTAVKGRCPRPLDDGDLLKIRVKADKYKSLPKSCQLSFCEAAYFFFRKESHSLKNAQFLLPKPEKFRTLAAAPPHSPLVPVSNYQSV